MRLNPVFEKEMKRNSRSSRISWIIFVCNLLLAVVAFVCYFGESSQLGYLAPVSYSVPMNCYILMTYLLFILVVLSVPAVAGGSISLEREKKTLDVLLGTGFMRSTKRATFLLHFSKNPEKQKVIAHFLYYHSVLHS